MLHTSLKCGKVNGNGIWDTLDRRQCSNADDTGHAGHDTELLTWDVMPAFHHLYRLNNIEQKRRHQPQYGFVGDAGVYSAFNVTFGSNEAY